MPAYLRRLVRPGLRVTVCTPSGARLAAAEEPIVPTIPAPQPGLLTRLFRRLSGPQSRTRITAVAPIRGRGGDGVIGRLKITQTSDRWAQLRDHTLEQMLNLTLATSALAGLIATGLAIQMALRAWRRRH